MLGVFFGAHNGARPPTIVESEDAEDGHTMDCLKVEEQLDAGLPDQASTQVASEVFDVFVDFIGDDEAQAPHAAGAGDEFGDR
jgi:hypothetical protein